MVASEQDLQAILVSGIMPLSTKNRARLINECRDQFKVLLL